MSFILCNSLLLYRNCKKFGQQSWVIAAIIVTEFLIVLKFDFQLIMRPFPPHVTIGWTIGLALLFIYTIWRFCLYFFIGKRHRRTRKVGEEHKSADTSLEKTKSKPVNGQSHRVFQNGDSKDGVKNGTVKSASPYRTRYRVRTANGT